MADNTLQHGTDTIATDELTSLNEGAVSGFKVQRVKVGYGVDGDLNDVARNAPLPVLARPVFPVWGHYQYVGVTGSIAAGAGADSEIFQLRWVDTNLIAVLELLQVDFLYATTAFAAGLGTLRATVAKSWSADGSGGNALTLTGTKMRTSFSSSAFSTGARIATTAALGAGTKTFDASDLGQYRDTIGTALNTNLLSQKPVVLFKSSVADGEHPLVLAQNEGVAIRATVPGSGVWIAGITARWAEVVTY